MGFRDAKATKKVEELFKEEEVKGTAGAGARKGGFESNPVDDLGLGLDAFIDNDVSSEYVDAFVKVLAEKLPKDRKFKKGNISYTTELYKFDKANPDFANLAYSYIVVANKFSNDSRIFYHVLILGATGDITKPINSVVQGIMENKPESLFSIADVNDPYLAGIIKKTLAADFNVTEDKLVNTNALYLPKELTPEEAAERGGTLALNANIGRWGAVTGTVPLINIGKLSTQGLVSLEVTSNLSKSVNAVKDVIRSDFQLRTSIKKVTNNQNIRGVNGGVSNIEISNTLGYIDYLPIEDKTPMQYGLPAMTKIKPMVILNDFVGRKPFIDTVIMGIANAAVLTKPEHLASILLYNQKDIGVLNFLTNVVKKKQNSIYGDIQHIKSGKFTEQEVMGYINKCFDPNPNIYLEIDVYSPYFDAKSPFAALALYNSKPEAAKTANDFIVNAIESMLKPTLGEAATIQNRKVFYMVDELPIGHFINKSGEVMDIRSIDLTDVIELTKDPIAITEWTASNVGGLAGKSALETRLDVLNKIVPNATYENRTIRVMLDPAFFKEVAEKLVISGYNPRIEGIVGQAFGVNDISALTAKFAGLGVGGINFGSPYQNQGFNRNMNAFYTGFGF